MLASHAPRSAPSTRVGGRAYPAERRSAAAVEPAAACLRALLALEMHGAVLQLLPALVLLHTTHDLEPLLVELLGRYLGAADPPPSLARRHSGSGRALVADVATVATPAKPAAAASGAPPSGRRQLARAAELQGLLSASLCGGSDTGDSGVTGETAEAAEAADAAEAAAGLWCGVLARAAQSREWPEAPLRLLADALAHGLVTQLAPRLRDAPAQLRACVLAVNAHAAATGGKPPAPLALLRAGAPWLAYAVALTIEPQLTLTLTLTLTPNRNPNPDPDPYADPNPNPNPNPKPSPNINPNTLTRWPSPSSRSFHRSGSRRRPPPPPPPPAQQPARRSAATSCHARSRSPRVASAAAAPPAPTTPRRPRETGPFLRAWSAPPPSA